MYPLRPLAVNVSVSQTHDRPSFEGYPGKGDFTPKGFDALESGQEPDVESGLH